MMIINEYEVTQVFFNAFKTSYKGWYGKKSAIMLNENLVCFTTFDGDDFVNLVFDKSSNELLGDIDVLDENKIDSVKSTLIDFPIQLAK